MNGPVPVVISLDPGSSPAEVLERLASAGLEDAELQPVLGIVTGRAAPGSLDSLRAVDGVEAVEVSRAVHI